VNRRDSSKLLDNDGGLERDIDGTWSRVSGKPTSMMPLGLELADKTGKVLCKELLP
jgi:hypothetical protein